MTMPTNDDLSRARTYLVFAYDSLLLARFGTDKDYYHNDAVGHLKLVLSFLGLQAIPLPPASEDRSIGMTVGDAG